jgi:transposase
MRRHELSDAHFQRIAPLLPESAGPGHPWAAHRPILNGIFWRLRTGVPWRDIPARYGPWQTIYDRFVRWRRDGTWARIVAALQIQLDAAGRLDWDQWCVDSTVIRASRAAAGARKKGGPTPPNRPIMP